MPCSMAIGRTKLVLIQTASICFLNFYLHIYANIWDGYRLRYLIWKLLGSQCSLNTPLFSVFLALNIEDFQFWYKSFSHRNLAVEDSSYRIFILSYFITEKTNQSKNLCLISTCQPVVEIFFSVLLSLICTMLGTQGLARNN